MLQIRDHRRVRTASFEPAFDPCFDPDGAREDVDGLYVLSARTTRESYEDEPPRLDSAEARHRINVAARHMLLSRFGYRSRRGTPLRQSEEPADLSAWGRGDGDGDAAFPPSWDPSNDAGTQTCVSADSETQTTTRGSHILKALEREQRVLRWSED